jgi:hypothetical protein
MKYEWLRLRCENPRCPQRRGLWRRLLDPPQGVLLHNQWLCSLQCLNQVLEELVSPLIESSQAKRETKAHRFPLGLLMLSRGLISNESLQAALQAQREAGKGRVGDWLRQQGAVTEPQVTHALAMQWSLPIYPLEKQEADLNWAHLVPLPLLDAFQMLPVHCTPAGGLLHVAFSSRVDYTALYAIEQMLECRTEPCLAQESYLERVLERLHQECGLIDTPLEGPIEPSIISTATLQEAIKLGAQEVRVVGCANNIWVRLRAPKGARDLLFHRAAEDFTRAPEHSKIPQTDVPPLLDGWIDRLY